MTIEAETNASRLKSEQRRQQIQKKVELLFTTAGIRDQREDLESTVDWLSKSDQKYLSENANPAHLISRDEIVMLITNVTAAVLRDQKNRKTGRRF